MAVVTDLLIAAKNGSEKLQYYPIAKNIPININYNLADVREPDKRKASFSKTINLLGTNAVNKLFENIFSVNVATQYFNKNLKTPCKYIVDGIQNFAGDLQLIKINIKPDNSIDYECSIIGEGGSLFVDIGDKLITGNPLKFETSGLLIVGRKYTINTFVAGDNFTSVASVVSGTINTTGCVFIATGTTPTVWTNESILTSSDDLDFSAYDHAYTRANQIALNVANEGTGLGVVYPFIDNAQNGSSDTVFNVESFLPCFHNREYIDKIITNTGRTWTSSILDDAEFLNHITYPNLINLQLTQAQLDLKQFYVGLTANTAIPTGTNTDVTYTNDSTNGFFDLGGQLAPVNNFVTLNANGNYNVAAVNYVKITATHTDPAVAYFKGNSQLVTTIVKSGNGGVGYFNLVPAVITSVVSASVPPGTGAYPIGVPIYGNNGAATGSQFFAAGDILLVKVNVFYPTSLAFYNAAGAPITPTGTFTYNVELVGGAAKTSFYALCSQKTIIAGDTMTCNSALPTKIKQKDYLKSIIQALNLFIDVDPNNPNNLIIESFNEFYNGDIIDYENKTDLSKDQSINPNILEGKKYIYTYKADTDKWNEQYKNEFNEVFGTHEEDVENDFIKSDKKNEIIFSPTPNVANYGLGIAMPRIYKEENLVKKQFASNIRWLICGGIKQTVTPYTWQQTGQTNLVTNDYLYAGHTDDPLDPNVDLNFGLPKKVYYDYPNAYFTTNNLYNRYHAKYLNNLINRDAKFVTKYLWLSPKDIYNFNFRNRLFIDGAYYIVNKIENYNPLELTSTKVELIKLLETQIFTPTKFLISSSPEVAGGVEVYNSTLNTSFSFGTGNQNRGTNCLAVGDNIMIPASCENVTVIGSNISVPENTIGFSYINGTVTNTIYNEKALIQNKSANYNVKAYDDVVFMTTGATNKTVTLAYTQIGFLESTTILNINDVETTLEYGKQITIKKVDSGAGNVIIDGNGALIDGAATITLTTQYESVTLQWDGTNWNKI
jgi:hypothetical protein